MQELYWSCLGFGIVFTVVTVLFGDLFDSVLDGFMEWLSFDGLDWLQPVVVVGGMTAFGGAGIMLTAYTAYDQQTVIILSLLAATLLSIAVYFVYIKPMKNCENYVGFFEQDLVGKRGEVLVPVPARGYGEVLVRVGAGNINRPAVSSDKTQLAAGAAIVVRAVDDGVLYVAVDQVKEQEV